MAATSILVPLVLASVLYGLTSARRLTDIPDILIRNVKVIETPRDDTDLLREPSEATDAVPSQPEGQGKSINWPPLTALGHDLGQSQGHILDSGIQGLSMDALQELIDTYGLHNLSAQIGRGSNARFLLEMYQKLQDGEDLPHAAGHTYVDAAILRADTIRSLPAQEAKKESKNSKKTTLTFDLSTISHREQTKRAELRIRPLRRRHNPTAQFRARVSVWDGDMKVKRLTYVLRAEKTTTDGFAVLDLTQIVKDVVDSGYEKAKLEITLKQLSKRGSRNRDGNEGSSTSRPKRSLPKALPLKKDDTMLVVFTRDRHFFEKFRYQATKKHLKYLLETGAKQQLADLAHLAHPEAHKPRSRRSSRAEKHLKRSIKDMCQKKDLIIDFNQIGWGEWIVFPKRFNAYQCDGKCPLPVDQSYDPTNHAVLQSLVRIRDRNATSRPCCVPSKLDSISMLYYEGDLIVVRHHKDMVVDKCGCR